MEPELLIPIGEAAMRLGVSVDTLRRWDKSGKLIAIRKNNIRYYLERNIDNFLSNLNLSTIAFDWASANTDLELPHLFYCQDSSIFQARLVKMKDALAGNPVFTNIMSLLVAITGEIGSNSFDHNLGNWPDVPGIFFGYDIEKKEIILADRGQGLLETLKRVKPSLSNHKDAINTAFTEIISGRSPEDRGNGLKFVKKIILENPINLFFQSGDYYLKMSGLDSDIDIRKSKDFIRGCIAIIKF